MEEENKAPYVPPFLRELMNGKNEEEILQASENLRGYVLAMYETYKRMQKER